MDRFPGRRSALNPLRLDKTLWLQSQCTKFLRNQELSSSNNLSCISRKLHNVQQKIGKLSYSDCSDLTRKHFGFELVEEEDMFADDGGENMVVDEDNVGGDYEDESDQIGDKQERDEDDSDVTGDNNEDEIEDSESEDDDSDIEEDDDKSADIEIKAILANSDISDLVFDEDNLPEHVVKSRRYQRKKKQFILSHFKDKNSQEIVSELSQVPKSVSKKQKHTYV